MENNIIEVRGAREHNLRNINLDLPKNQLIVFTGVSGSGKSSLAFDTLYAEGQRRYVESLSSYARQFLGQLQKPDVDYLAGLSPAISIQQKTAGRNPRSTVGTITEIHDYLRVLYARIGQGYCPECGRAITAQTRDQIIATILALPEGSRFLILAPVVRGQKGEYKDLFADMLRRGFIRARVDGQVIRLTDDIKLDRRIKHDIEIVIDRLKNDPKIRGRLAEAVEHALDLAEGTIIIAVEKIDTNTDKKDKETTYEDMLLSAHYACTHCQKSYEPPTPQMFSFNSPQGMCLDCDGLGMRYTFDPDLLIPDESVSFFKGAIPLVGALTGMGRWRRHIYEGVANTLKIDLKKPWKSLSDEHKNLLLQGSGDTHITYEWKQRGGKIFKHGGQWEGIIPQLMSSFKKTAAGPRRMQLEKYMRVVPCSACDQKRLNPQARSVQVGGKTLVELEAMPVGELSAWLEPETGELETQLSPVHKLIAANLLREIRGRVGFLMNVGLHYLTLDRTAPTLSGGEAQRIRLAGQIGCGLVGVLYILDEPSIGLHPRDNDRLLESLERLRNMGNTVVVVEHDEDTMRLADHIVDFGPGPGVRGGEVVAAGKYKEITANKDSLTGQYLSGKKQITIPKKRRQPKKNHQLTISGARHNNLKNVTVDIPLGLFVCVTGVSGSGKSSLINDILKEGLLQKYLKGNGKNNGKNEEETDDELMHIIGEHDGITGVEKIDKVIDIDQSPIGRTPRSNPATYIKVFDQIRDLFAQMNEAKIRGYKPGRFSFNRPGGRCEACEGNGSNKLEMDFLADVWVTCPVCEGRRFNRETLQVRFKGKTIFNVLNMDVQEALDLFSNIAKVRDMLQTLHDVGLDYLKLGQPSPTLSGGEAQRIKLARELCKRSTGQTLYILDEPTTGLHFEDISKLLQVLQGFVESGNTVVVIEHNLDVVKTADWLIDLGPDGGSGGGNIVVTGTPEDVAKCKESYTGQALANGPLAKRKKATKKTAKGVKANGKASGNGQLTTIHVDGAHQHNLKNIEVDIPREKMTVCCGPSGSGKSSLALDTIYAEGQRRYVESLSSYARQFLGQVQKPKVENVSGLSPAISIEQKTTSKSPRSTVGTVTEIYDYLRILFARLGQPYCPKCQIPIGTQTADEIVDKIMSHEEGTKLYILAPAERRGQTSYEDLWDEIRKIGFTRIRVNRTSYNLSEPPTIDRRRKHDVEIVVDRIIVRDSQRGRIAESVEAALDFGKGEMAITFVEDGKDEPDWRWEKYSQHNACDSCGRSYEHLNPHHFSFNSVLGWCPTCEGLGFQRGANPTVLVRDEHLAISENAIAAWPDWDPESTFARVVMALAKHVGFSVDTPYKDLDSAHQRAILYGTGDDWINLPVKAPEEKKKVRKGSAVKPPHPVRFQYKGLMPAIDEASRVSFVYRHKLDSIVSEVPCTRCKGSRLKAEASACRFEGSTMAELCDWPMRQTLDFFDNLKLDKGKQQIAGEVLREIRNRLKFLVDVGLDYLTLSRKTPTLSGGESQRIRLASQIGSGLTGVLYVLDEPTIGLHPRDNRRLLGALNHLRGLGNTLLLVEHDREVIEASDFLLDFGPGAGIHGGEITAAGSYKQLQRSKKSLTGQYLSGSIAIPVPTNRRIEKLDESAQLTVVGARHNNLKKIDVAFPLGCLVSITGVSGSGKSSLINDILWNALARKLNRARTVVGAHDDILGLEHIDKAINVDQNPIGNTPSSNPATYTGLFDLVRQLFARMPEAKICGYQPKRFSFNKPGGRCEDCEGNGQKKIEMHFLPDVWVECETCKGNRYNPETLAVKYKEKSIADVLRMTVTEALELFENVPKIRRILQTLADVGLEYLSLGQSAPTLSGGEAQRVKLAAELSRPNTGRTVYLLDEPTTGLHFDDIRKLLIVLNRLVDLGNTVIVVEHNRDVIKSSDWIIDLGPEAGESGGEIVASGSPEVVAKVKGSHTGEILADVLKAGPHAVREKYDPYEEAKKQEEDVDIEEIGQDTQMPWEADGRKWHSEDCVSHAGKPCRWEGKLLLWLDEQIHQLGEFSDTNWNHRSVIEIAGKVKSQGWFLHAMTGQEWTIRLVFRVSRNAFKQDKLSQSLAIPTLNDTEGVEAYGNESRVQVVQRKGPWQDVILLVHRLSEIDTPAFRDFLKEAVASFEMNLVRLQTKPEDVMPWKVNGEKWHLGPKGFPAGKKMHWDRDLLPRFLELVRQTEPDITIRWDTRDAVTLYLPGITRMLSQWKTKSNTALDCRFVVQNGQFNLSQLEGFGKDPEIQDHHDKVDVVRLQFQRQEHFPVKELKTFLRDAIDEFRNAFLNKQSS